MQNYRHLLEMTDETGMLQFSNIDIPNPASGYTLDDNARALMVAINMGPSGKEYALRYANFLFNAQQQDGSWSNFYIHGQFLPYFDSQDSVGRALLACALGRLSKIPEIKKLCGKMLENNIPKVHEFNSPRAISYALIGLCKGKIPGYSKKKLNDLVLQLSDQLIAMYQKNNTDEWHWFENYLTYCNGILPNAMFSVYGFNGDKRALKIGHESLSFLNNILFEEGYLNIVGNNGWYHKGQELPRFDQQPVDAASIAFACLEAYETIGKKEYLDLAKLAHQWYYGKNYHNIPLFNEKTGGCYDALTEEGVNLNQGAEAVLSLLLTDLAIEKAQNVQLSEEQPG
ncbi:Glycosyltransferase [Candidatus Syntrophocurvum alkaliphilum]|uniref:Glycosyltransferase n=1 Tax=Candidatus Syntrophocurvum alkaliphilum TaxID=2293317 RepID=A0A6I6DH37_9FIRM|nr:hypothetical protein [Candidatus Syntrophocurvum alkaliphilum]QGU00123.1 Glycosyltransferase [Candidatus Syntrophocurvum alkaliphilum]